MKYIEQTLLEQMQMTDVEISDRMQLLNLSNEDLNLLFSHKLVIQDNINMIVDEFYEKQIEIDEISLLIGDADTLSHLRSIMRKYVIDLFSGHHDSEYVNNRLHIGMAHRRIGVEPKLYISGMKTLKNVLTKTLERTIIKNEILDSTLEALDKLLCFDTTLIFDAYLNCMIREIENAKKRTEAYAKSLEVKVAERTKQLEAWVNLDPLTNIYNHRAMQDFLRRELSAAKRRQTKLSLVYFDVDHFKAINDTYGHTEGDEVLRNIGQILLKCIRDIDIPCRCGGDEFCLILPECGMNDAKTICEKIIKEFSGKYPDYSLSIGIAETGLDEYIDGDQLIKIADDKMYLAKKDNGFQIRM